MSLSLYSISIPSYIQTMQAIVNVLKKGEEFCKQNDINVDDMLKETIHPTMFPLSFQLNSVLHHSKGALKGIESGVMGPPPNMKGKSYNDFVQLLEKAIEEFKAMSEDSINEMSGKEMKFKMGSFEVPFHAENFILSFSLPNFYFHCSTTYDILRMKGVEIGKMDFMGQMRIG